MDRIKGFLNSVSSAPGTAISFKLPSLSIPGGPSIGGQTLSVPNIPTLDSGALVTGPTIAALAMNNRPELVTPLDKAGGAGGLTIHVHMDGATILTADDAEQFVVDMVDRGIRRGVTLGVA